MEKERLSFILSSARLKKNNADEYFCEDFGLSPSELKQALKTSLNAKSWLMVLLAAVHLPKKLLHSSQTSMPISEPPKERGTMCGAV